MRSILLISGLALLAGCSSNTMYYSPYDYDRDGTLDYECPGMEYDATKHTIYGWRSKASKECHEQMEEKA